MKPTREPEFRAWRISRLKMMRILLVIGVPIGIFMGLPIVWGLAILGIIVSTIKINLIDR